MAVRSVRDGKRRPKKAAASHQIEANGKFHDIPDFSSFSIDIRHTPHDFAPYKTVVECSYQGSPPKVVVSLFTGFEHPKEAEFIRLKSIVIGAVTKHFLKNILQVRVEHPTHTDKRAMKVIQFWQTSSAHDQIINEFISELGVVHVMHS